MNLNFTDFEIPLLKALIKPGGRAKPSEVYPEVEKMMGLNPTEFPGEYEKYKSNMIKWKNKTAWAREYLKRKEQLDGSERGVWKITKIGTERVKSFNKTKKDPDEGLAPLQGVEVSISDENITPKKVSTRSRTCKYMKPVVYLEYGALCMNPSTNKASSFCSPPFVTTWGL